MRLAPALLVALLAAPAAAAERVTSLNLCTDQLLLHLVGPERIASVSPLARDPRLSYLAERAAAVPANSGRGETILLEPPGLVLAGPFESRARRDMLRAQGFEVMVLGLWTRLDEGRAQVRTLAERLGVPERGEALVAAIDTALARAKAIAPPRSVLVLQRRGYTPGATSMMDDLLRHMGLVPHTHRLGLPSGGTVPLERLVADPPDYVLMAASDAGAVDQGSALLHHPALEAVLPPERRLVLPDRLTICGGPSTPAAIDALAAAVRATVR